MKRQTFNEINITPLTDIFLVLLILMMVIAPILDQQGISLAIPEYVEENNVNKEAKILNVKITADDRYFIDDVEVLESDLYQTLKSQKDNFQDGVLIQASGDSSHSSVVSVMDNARNAGVQSISIVEI